MVIVCLVYSPPWRILCVTRSLRFEYALMIVCSLICSSVASGRGRDTREETVDESVSRMILGRTASENGFARCCNSYSPIVDGFIDSKAHKVEVLENSPLVHLAALEKERDTLI